MQVRDFFIVWSSIGDTMQHRQTILRCDDDEMSYNDVYKARYNVETGPWAVDQTISLRGTHVGL